MRGGLSFPSIIRRARIAARDPAHRRAHRQAASAPLGFCPALSSIRSKATSGTSQRLRIRIAGISPAFTAAYAALREMPSLCPASSTLIVARSIIRPSYGDNLSHA
jgi:hypothetical protein